MRASAYALGSHCWSAGSVAWALYLPAGDVARAAVERAGHICGWAVDSVELWQHQGTLGYQRMTCVMVAFLSCFSTCNARVGHAERNQAFIGRSRGVLLVEM